MTVLGVVTVTAPVFSCREEEQGIEAALTQTQPQPQTQPQSVYRFQTRKARTCNACRMHQHYKVFLSEATADQNRAHPRL